MPSINSKTLAWIPLLLVLYNFCANLSNDIYLPSLPALKDVFATSSSIVQMTMTAWFAGVALPQLFLGPLSDQIGRRPIILGGGLCFCLATLLCMLAPTIEWLLLGRFFQGVGVCSLNVTSFSILVDLYDYKNRTKLMNKINMCGTFAPLIGPFIGGYVLTFAGWRASFAIILLMAIVSVTGLYYQLPESNLFKTPQATRLKTMYRNYYLLICNKGFIQHLIPYCLLLGGLIVYLTAAPFIIIDKLHIPAYLFGYTQIPVFSTYLLGAIYLGLNTDELKTKKMLFRGLIIVLCASLLMFVLSLLFSENLYIFLIPMGLYALGFSLCASPLVVEIMSTCTTSKGSGAAFLGFGMALSCMLSSSSLGMFYNGRLFSVACLMLVIVIISIFVFFLPPYQKPALTEQVLDSSIYA